MTTYTSAQSGSWSSSSTWDPTGVPGNGDTVTIQPSHIVVFDADQSSFTNGLSGLTINGTLSFARTSPTYLKVKATVTGDGKLEVGTRANPISRPAAPTSPMATIHLNGSYYLSLDTVEIAGWTPDVHRTRLAANAASGATQIVLEDDMGLQKGDKIVIGANSCSGPFNTSTESNEGLFTVQSYDASTKTVTLSSGLGYPRKAGDFVAYYDQTVRISTSASDLFQNLKNLYVEGAFLNAGFAHVPESQMKPIYHPILAEKATIDGSTKQNLPLPYTPAGRGVLQSMTFYASKVLAGALEIRDSVAIHSGSDHGGFGGFIDSLVADTWIGNISYPGAHYNPWDSYLAGRYMRMESCELRGSPYLGSLGQNILYVTDTHIPRLVIGGCVLRLTNCTIDTIAYRAFSKSGFGVGYVESRDHQGVPGAWRAYTHGGSMQKVTDVTPPGRSGAIQTTHVNDRAFIIYGEPVGLLEPGEVLRATAWLRKNKTTAEMPYTPRLQILSHPFPHLSIYDDAVVAEKPMDPSKVNEWEYVTIEYENTTDSAQEYSVRVKTCAGTGNVWFTLDHDILNRARIFMIR